MTEYDVNGIELLIFKSIFNEELFPIIYPDLKSEYFENVALQDLFKFFKEYYKEYAKNDLKGFLLFLKQKKLSKDEKEAIKKIVKVDDIEDKEILLKEIEKYLKRQALSIAILEGADLLQQNKYEYFQDILGKVEEALQISFDTDLGLDIKDNIDNIESYLRDKNRKIPTGVPSLDKAFGGGFEHKRLTILASPTHGGKTALSIFLASQFIQASRNGIYYTLEMPAEEIAIRFYSSLFGITTWDVKKMDSEEIKNRLSKMDLGKLIIKDYPAGVLNDLMIKTHIQKLSGMGVKIDFIVVDYIGLMASSRISLNKAGGTYLYYKYISEELHALAKSLDIMVLTSSQLNRSAYNNTETDMSSISDSAGQLHTADNLILMLQSEKMRQNNQQIWKIEKNRQEGILKSILVETDFARTRYKDLSEAINDSESGLSQNIVLNSMKSDDGDDGDELQLDLY